MATIAIARVGITLKFEDGKEVRIDEGDIVSNLAYKVGVEEKTISGAVRVIMANTKGQNSGTTTCPPDPYVHGFISPTTLIIDHSDVFGAKLTRIPISNIMDIGEVRAPVAGEDDPEDTVTIGPGAQYKTLSEVVAVSEPGTTVKLLPGTYEAPLTLNKSITISGSNDVVLTGKLMVAGEDAAEPISVELNNVELSGDALVETGANVESFTMTGCVFGGHNIATKTMPIAVKSETPIDLQITGNTFKAEPAGSYNLIDVYGKLKDGSSISGNVFEDDCCGHNQISLYGIDDGATVHIDDNVAAVSKNMVRIGFKGTPTGTVVMDRNSYKETDSDPRWAGLVLVQPYGALTTSFAGLTVKINDTVYPAGTQLGYIYAAGSDTPFTADNKPKFVINGIAVAVPDPDEYHVGSVALESMG